MVVLIGEVVSPVQQLGDDAVSFRLAVASPEDGAGADVVTVRAHGGQAGACHRFLRPGHRAAVEGRIAPGCPADVLAERVQFLTTRAQAEAMRDERAAA